jgi:hypothetical protein
MSIYGNALNTMKAISKRTLAPTARRPAVSGLHATTLATFVEISAIFVVILFIPFVIQRRERLDKCFGGGCMVSATSGTASQNTRKLGHSPHF